METNENSHFVRYLEILETVKELEKEKEILGKKIQEEMLKNQIYQVKNGKGMFFFMTRRIWTYPEYIQDKETELKTMKKTAEIKKEATCIESKHLSYRRKSSTGSKFRHPIKKTNDTDF